MNEDDYLMISGIQHFRFCKRQWALIHIEQQWTENDKTIKGQLFHNRANELDCIEKRNNVLIFRAMKVKSNHLCVTGICDIVEFHQSPSGVQLFNYEGVWKPFPIEYKVGAPKLHNADELQLCAEAMCLEEMLCCHIDNGALYYGDIRRRKKVEFSQELRKEVQASFAEMHDLMNKGWTPKTKQFKGCKSCSLKDLCLPKLSKCKTVKSYIDDTLDEG